MIHEVSEGIIEVCALSSTLSNEERKDSTRQQLQIVNSGREKEKDEDQDSITTRLWKESPFAVGKTKASWADEEIRFVDCCRGCFQCSDTCHMKYTAWICSILGAKRVGNMAVICQRMENVEEDSTTAGQDLRRVRPRLICIIGPYWPIAFCVVVPFFLALGLFTAIKKLPSQHWGISLSWTICNVCLFVAFFQVSCRDPGILYRHAQRPTDEDEPWVWNDQALTYRPSHAKYDPDCAVVVDYFDHTCPWMGTAIGGKNMFWFKFFLVSVPVVIIYNITLLTIL